MTALFSGSRLRSLAVWCLLWSLTGPAASFGQAAPAALVSTLLLLDSIPSGSGMAGGPDSFYIAGDDAASVYKLSGKTARYRRIPLASAPPVYRIPRDVKPDYEAAVIDRIGGRECLLLFGSGSLSPRRDSLLLLETGAESRQGKIDLRPLYNQLIRASGIRPYQLNIEAATRLGSDLCLLNRSTNHIFALPFVLFEQALRTGAPVHLDSIRVQRMVLPATGGVAAGFSGACDLDAHTLLFSASVEDRATATTDGPVLGSYIGTMRRDDAGLFTLQSVLPVLLPDGGRYGGKIESLVPAGRAANGALPVLAISDNDDGRTQLLTVRLQLPE